MARANSFASLIRYMALVSPRVVLLKDGCLMAGFRYSGTDLDAAPESEKGSVAIQANQAFKSLEEGYMLQFEAIRVPSTAYPSGNFSETVTAIIDHERKRQFEQAYSHFETETYCFLTWQPPFTEKNTTARKLLGFFTGDSVPHQIIDERQIANFERVFDETVYSLISIFNIEILENKELLSVINQCVTSESLGQFVERQENDLDCLFARDLEVGDPLIFNNQYIGVISIDGFPFESAPCILQQIASLPFECRWSSRFIPMDFRTALSRMTKEQRKWAQKKIPLMTQILDRPITRVNKDAVVQEEDVNDALQSLNAQLVTFGHYTSVILVRAEETEILDKYLKEIVRLFSERLFSARIEHRNALEAFIGSLPGHGHENVRKPLLHSLNYAHFVALGSSWPGLTYNPCPFFPPHSPALIQAATIDGNPFRVHHHVGDVGHTLVCGPTGSGKSTYLALEAAQFDRYENSQIFLFDKGRSMFPLIAAMKDAEYYNLGAEDTPALCPLAELNSKSDITWALEFVEALVLLNKGEMNPQRRMEIENALITMSQATTSSMERSLSALATNIQDQHLKNALRTYTNAGTYGQYLDGQKTAIRYAKTCAFELEELMGHGEKVVVPTLLYLFREIEKRIDGRPTKIILDEAWLALDSALFSQKIREWLKVLRKGNASVTLATQNLTDIMDSEIASAIFDSCPTKILLANSEARSDSMRALYKKALNLNDAEIMTIANAMPKRDYFYVSPIGRRLFRLNLGDVSLSFVGSSGKADLAAIEELINLHGKKWPIEWLRKKQLESWADYWQKIEGQFMKEVVES